MAGRPTQVQGQEGLRGPPTQEPEQEHKHEGDATEQEHRHEGDATLLHGTLRVCVNEAAHLPNMDKVSAALYRCTTVFSYPPCSPRQVCFSPDAAAECRRYAATVQFRLQEGDALRTDHCLQEHTWESTSGSIAGCSPTENHRVTGADWGCGCGCAGPWWVCLIATVSVLLAVGVCHGVQGPGSDPYAVVSLDGAPVAHTRAVKDNQFPNWNSPFVVQVAHLCRDIILTIKVHKGTLAFALTLTLTLTVHAVAAVVR